MSANDIFYYSSSFAVIVAVIAFVYLVGQLTLTLKSLRRIIDDIGDTTADITAFRQTVKKGFSIFGSLFGQTFARGGVNYGKRRKRG